MVGQGILLTGRPGLLQSGDRQHWCRASLKSRVYDQDQYLSCHQRAPWGSWKGICRWMSKFVRKLKLEPLGVLEPFSAEQQISYPVVWLLHVQCQIFYNIVSISFVNMCMHMQVAEIRSQGQIPSSLLANLIFEAGSPSEQTACRLVERLSNEP